MTREYSVAILGATGAVGTRLIEQLEQSTIPVKNIKLLASSRSAGKTLQFKGTDVVVEEATPESFDGVDLVLASGGGSVSARFAPEAVKRGAVVVDNSSQWRMNDDVPLIVPEVNEADLKQHQGIIANPNCSTIQMVVALAPIKAKYGLTRVIVSTYQAASGAGQSAWQELVSETDAHNAGKEMHAEILPVKSAKHHYPLAYNLLPQIDVFEEDGYTHEEWKMIHETKKIMFGDKNSKAVKVTATAVRVPVPIGHGETVYFETDAGSGATAADIQAILSEAPGVVLEDNPKEQLYPQPINAEGKRETFVGRVRPDLENDDSFHMWVVSDNLLKGAAWNTVQIAERLVDLDLVRVPEDAANKFVTA
ncbi:MULTISPECIES: aspartate-semialdehyde dehydrogenase [Leuconostoc]|jgi:aspartate-semialdehyde dehydrogenase|uniref:Aspartate-semialdehyde dehydrogenase n=1 Tax=Leuconostoc mesenteroides subsp. mesenteroides (strain ATCC 8293 / DSM 20343 / BCRC 11652 / CCM 1803 / JCM 6124 / NCDO 523 / NBRC 100496 / NCIMB 8023 / NCTC 12954 / NRRL B-1118 / 37Y) TaxID=203120 RepID=Q03UW1_LEUMM|nr:MULTISPECIES: aspartate-semialdehyde dehydrogenase [Leuconostoc]ABJ63011.1 aspartate semialdehyde dehydrogenase [Leuconostoc mesenteroides subsp. mesenteroides ATCC 8293]AET31135.1 aspartate-semialdehyde dehydrogenase [Leuconostoc mesenteroides subsp. mesenteroides J18]AQU50081.1 aspartate-semialdehyde dehydrogenase [Leuconostoc mesenteroides subsp. mesenteroides]KAA8370067.1 aspartate-semialdehyde dehydrogenase [Leuconostoc mesenteroides]MBD9364716.1 aspartate-semialdehyde dehydrogenase [L